MAKSVVASFILCVTIAHARKLREQQKNLLSDDYDKASCITHKNQGWKERKAHIQCMKRHPHEYLKKSECDKATPNEWKILEPVCRDVDPFHLVQMADPQLGMENLAANTIDKFLDWANEKKMLQLSAEATQKLVKSGVLSRATEVIVHGDMQNWYPCDSTKPCNEDYADRIGRLSDMNAGGPTTFLGKFSGEADKSEETLVAKLQGRLSPSGESNIGDWQKKEAREALSAFKGGIHYLPGNHDVGDKPDAAGLVEYEKQWGADSVKQYFTRGKVAFIVLNSQVMQSDDDFAKKKRAEQFKWLDQKMQHIQDQELKGVVLMMHIPPFMNSPTEKQGWGNQLQSARDDLRDIIFKENYELVPQLIICGHFHNNVLKTFPIESWAGDKLAAGLEDRDIELVVSSTVGARMDWGGSHGEMKPAKAAETAGLANGGVAFFTKIMDGDPKKFALIGQRVGASQAKSGVRIFEFSNDGYRHEWVTVAKLPKFGGTFGGKELTPWNDPRDKKEKDEKEETDISPQKVGGPRALG